MRGGPDRAAYGRPVDLILTAASEPTTGGAGSLTTVVAVLGFALACLSLGWQVATYVLAGARISCELRAGSAGVGGAVTAPVGDIDFRHLRQQGYDRPVAGVVARNKGRLPINVQRYSSETELGFSFQQFDMPHNPPLPYRLDPGAEVTFLTDLHNIVLLFRSAEDVHGKKSTKRVRGVIGLANGKTKKTKWHSGEALIIGRTGQ